ncbi:hypothetical protein FN846DRAFT_976948 [Sphaerosporella brunnea]|uniref:Uncharacterized protein n=1 Tax=Sphaerosporella brunnea TaxID=1250544 RepID=A0A5J5EFH5_9PEZI|nr:hypothetical protein FN846DRAFT_976948 [Sphaerosporella brunnea]
MFQHASQNGWHAHGRSIGAVDLWSGSAQSLQMRLTVAVFVDDMLRGEGNLGRGLSSPTSPYFKKKKQLQMAIKNGLQKSSSQSLFNPPSPHLGGRGATSTTKCRPANSAPNTSFRPWDLPCSPAAAARSMRPAGAIISLSFRSGPPRLVRFVSAWLSMSCVLRLGAWAMMGLID